MILLALVQRLLALTFLAALGVGVWLIWSWRDLERGGLLLDPPYDPSNARLYWGIALLAWAFLGRFPMLLLLGKGGGEHRRLERGESRIVEGPDGSKLHVETFGPAAAPVIVLTHGWGMDSTIWVEARRHLAGRFRLVVWDLPGLGRSSQPSDGCYTIDRLADDLDAVIKAESPKGRVLLLGHSIGGMIVQTYCRNYRDTAPERVAGIVLENTTHTNPLQTIALGGLLRPLQKPVIEPMMKLDVLISPLLRLMNWHSYLSGSTQLAFRMVGFGGRPTRAQVDHAALLATRNSPAVQAKGNLAMMNWSVTDDLPVIAVPALVFIGCRDLITLPEAGEFIAASVRNSRAVIVPEAGHMGPVECAADYNTAIEAFADEVMMAGALNADAGATIAAPASLEVRRATGAPPLEPKRPLI